MKIRATFVSNSSSSSFVIDTTKITKEQFDKIVNHIKHAKYIVENVETEKDEWGSTFFSCCDEGNEWNVTVHEDNMLMLDTSMDNFDMKKYLKYIKADEAIIFEDDTYWSWSIREGDKTLKEIIDGKQHPRR